MINTAIRVTQNVFYMGTLVVMVTLARLLVGTMDDINTEDKR